VDFMISILAKYHTACPAARQTCSNSRPPAMRYEPLVLMLLLLQSALPLWGWPTVAEAWTSGDEQSPIEAAYRMFTASDGHCATAPSPARLVAKSPVVLSWVNGSRSRACTSMPPPQPAAR